MFDTPISARDDDVEQVAPRDPFFNPWRVPRGENVKIIIDDVLNQLGHYERLLGVRQRARKEADLARYERIVGGIICDLVHRHLLGDDDVLAISLSKRDLGRSGRYESPVGGKQLPGVLGRLATPEMAFAEVTKGCKGNPFARGLMTTIRAGERLQSRIDEHAVELSDLGQDLDQETIMLKAAKRDYWDNGDRIDYKDTAQTRRLRSEMRTINEWLADADVTYDPALATNRWVDDTDRLLRRFFNNGSFELGGRLFGGFWQGLKKAERRDGIRIGGETVVTLDYGQMAPRILYSLVGAGPPDGDAYAIPGYEFWRPGIKKVFSALQFVKGDLVRKPKGTRRLLPHRAISEVTAAIRTHHKPIAHLLDDMVGHKVFFRESQVLVEVLLRLKSLGIVALPIHDAVVIPVSDKEATEAVMLDVFRSQLGIEGKVEVEE